MLYNWQLKTWKKFTFDEEVLNSLLEDYYQKKTFVFGLKTTLSKNKEMNAMLESMILEALKTSEIEGEIISREEVMSSLKRNLGLSENIKPTRDKRAEGVAELMIAVRKNFSRPLSRKMLFDWHTMLMSWNKHINVGRWRKGREPMQIVSGSVGKEKVHFEAPPSANVPHEMGDFIDWFNQTHMSDIGPIRAGLAHLYFESIHPFEDGNGRIGRAISEKALFQADDELLIVSISESIESNKKAYYNALKEAQRTNDVTEWLKYFINVLIDAVEKSRERLLFMIRKSQFLEEHKETLNERQLKVVHKMLERGHQGFEGGMNARKYMSITKASKATATRDLQKLLEIEVFTLMKGGGRSTSYELNIET